MQSKVDYLLYKATVESNNNKRNYFGLCETDFKTRFYNHTQSFKYREKNKATELSKFIWANRELGIEPQLSWSIVKYAQPYKSGSRNCSLCLEEKYAILNADDNALLNKRSELINKCRHKNKFKLINFKPG